MAFFKAKLQFVFVQGLIIEYIEIVQKQLHDNPHIFLKSQANHLLISGWNILKSKLHNQPNKCAQICDECNLVPIFGSYFSLMVIKRSNDKRIHLMSCHHIQDLFYKW
jgi:hypothetical protein